IGGLLRRVITPANIWLEAETGRVKILDFGLARAAGQEAQVTQQGAIVGTPAYMAPEQVLGQAIDPRCDLFSLGCLLYRLCTGKLPFKGKDTISTLMAVASDKPIPIRDLNPEIPPALDGLVMRLLAKKPEDRPGTAGAVVEVLAAIEADRTAVLDGQRIAPGPAQRPPFRRKRLLAGIAGGLLASVGITAGIIWINQGNGTDNP